MKVFLSLLLALLTGYLVLLAVIDTVTFVVTLLFSIPLMSALALKNPRSWKR